MKKLVLLITLVSFASASGCASREGSAVGGALGGAVGYEYSAHRQMKQVEDDYKAGRINKKEYEIRKNQIEKASLFQG